MKKFNLELAKAGHPVCTRAGRNVRIICYDSKELICDKSHPIVALVELPNGLEYLREYTIDGCLIANRGEYDDDLMMVTEHHEGWTNVHRGTSSLYIGSVFPSKEEAELDGTKNPYYIATAKIEWEE